MSYTVGVYLFYIMLKKNDQYIIEFQSVIINYDFMNLASKVQICL